MVLLSTALTLGALLPFALGPLLPGSLSSPCRRFYNMTMKIRRRIGRISKIVMFGALGLAVASGASSFLAGWLLVRPGRRRDYDCIPRIHYGKLEPLSLLTSDGVHLHAWYLLSRSAPPENWVLLLHGYRSDRSILYVRARFFARRGYNVLLLHFRGHGASERSRISYGYHERKDVKAAIDFIRSLRPGQPVRIGIDGISMGAAAAAYAVGNGEIEPEWMILESCYDNIRHALANRLALRVGDSLTPWLAWPVGLVVEQLIKLRAQDLDPAKALERCRCPVLILAGDSERVLRMVEIEYLYGCVAEPKRMVLFPGAGHEDLLSFDPRRFARAVSAFLRDFAPHGSSLPECRPQDQAGVA
jgi:pimeloyl-ACP methyl ester carboxylesterase